MILLAVRWCRFDDFFFLNFVVNSKRKVEREREQKKKKKRRQKVYVRCGQSREQPRGSWQMMVQRNTVRRI